MCKYNLRFVNYKTGETVAMMPIEAVDLDTAQVIADDMNSSFNVYAEEAE